MARQEETMRSLRDRLCSMALLTGALLWAPAPALAQPAPALDPRAILQILEDAFVSVADRATPSVVNISVKARKSTAAEGTPSPETEQRFREFFGPEFYERFFKRRGPRQEPERAAGSGVIVDGRGYILTNHHVIENADEIEVRLSDDRKFPAKLVGRDSKTDLAVLKIEPAGTALPVAALGDSDKLRIGQWAIAIGNPFGLDRTVTVGIISATGRTHVGVATYEAFIQTDASINPGNSGGPLLNIDGRVIGINTAIVSSGQGIGFSIPINMAREVMTQLIDKGRVVRGWLGISIQDLSPDLAAGFGVPGTGGVLVADVIKDSPAETGGLKAGDKIGEQPTDDTVVAAVPKGTGLGLSVEPLTPDIARTYGLSGRSGVVVTDVAEGSAAEAAGIRGGDLILEVNRRPVGSVDEFRKIVGGLKPGESVPVQLQRGGGGGREYVVLKAPEKP